MEPGEPLCDCCSLRHWTVLHITGIGDKVPTSTSARSQLLVRVPIGPLSRSTPVSKVKCEGDQNHCQASRKIQ